MAFDLEIATATVYMEASGEPNLGKLGVAMVLVNRLRSGKYATLAAVCLAPEQFSCWNTSDPNRSRLAHLPDTDELLLVCEATVKHALTLAPENDPTQGATNYFAITIPTPFWARALTKTVQIGKHIFMK